MSINFKKVPPTPGESGAKAPFTLKLKAWEAGMTSNGIETPDVGLNVCNIIQFYFSFSQTNSQRNRISS